MYSSLYLSLSLFIYIYIYITIAPGAAHLLFDGFQTGSGQTGRSQSAAIAIPPNEFSWTDVGKVRQTKQHVGECGNMLQHVATRAHLCFALLCFASLRFAWLGFAFSRKTWQHVEDLQSLCEKPFGPDPASGSR